MGDGVLGIGYWVLYERVCWRMCGPPRFPMKRKKQEKREALPPPSFPALPHIVRFI